MTDLEQGELVRVIDAAFSLGVPVERVYQAAGALRLRGTWVDDHAHVTLAGYHVLRAFFWTPRNTCA